MRPSTRIGSATSRSDPRTGSSIAWIEAEPSGDAKTSSSVRTGAQGTDAASSAASHSAAGRRASSSDTIGISWSRLRTRSALVANRSSDASSGRPITPQVRSKSRSFPAARMNGRSAASNSWYGTMLGCALPSGRGTRPPSR